MTVLNWSDLRGQPVDPSNLYLSGDIDYSDWAKNEPGSSGLVVVSKTPLGVPTPSGGWAVAAADGASQLGPVPGAPGSYLGPNRDPRGFPTPRPSINPVNGVAVYENSRVAVTPLGYELTSVPGVGPYGTSGQGDSINISTGWMCSAYVNNQGGAPGFNGIKGFMWNPVGQSGKTYFEFVVTYPAINTGAGTWGLEIVMWFEDPTGQWEWDAPELDSSGGPVNGAAFYTVINHNTSTQTQQDLYLSGAPGDPVSIVLGPSLALGGKHTFGFLIDSDFQTFDQYLDGVHVPGGPIAWPAGLGTNPMHMNLLLDWRSNVGVGGVGPTFVTPQKAQFRSWACYQSQAHLGAGIKTFGSASNNGTPWTVPLIQTGTILG